MILIPVKGDISIRSLRQKWPKWDKTMYGCKPCQDDFDDEICHLKAKSIVDNVKCYMIAILNDVNCFSLQNFSHDGLGAISFLIAKIGIKSNELTDYSHVHD